MGLIKLDKTCLYSSIFYAVFCSIFIENNPHFHCIFAPRYDVVWFCVCNAMGLIELDNMLIAPLAFCMHFHRKNPHIHCIFAPRYLFFVVCWCNAMGLIELDNMLIAP